MGKNRKKHLDYEFEQFFINALKNFKDDEFDEMMIFVKLCKNFRDDISSL